MMTAERLGAIAGLGLTLIFSYAPGLSVWYEKQSGQVKSLIMLAALVVSAGAIFGLSCYSPWQIVQCTEEAAWGLGEMLFYAIVLNVSSHALTKKLHTKTFWNAVSGGDVLAKAYIDSLVAPASVVDSTDE